MPPPPPLQNGDAIQCPRPPAGFKEERNERGEVRERRGKREERTFQAMAAGGTFKPEEPRVRKYPGSGCNRTMCLRTGMATML